MLLGEQRRIQYSLCSFTVHSLSILLIYIHTQFTKFGLNHIWEQGEVKLDDFPCLLRLRPHFRFVGQKKSNKNLVFTLKYSAISIQIITSRISRGFINISILRMHCMCTDFTSRMITFCFEFVERIGIHLAVPELGFTMIEIFIYFFP